MQTALNRRAFVKHSLAGALALTDVRGMLNAIDRPAPPKFTDTTITGKPRERGRQYGKAFAEGIDRFLQKEIHQAFIGKPAPRDDMLRYAGACARVIHKEMPIIHDEMEGIAEGTGKRLEEIVLILLHEELFHKGALPKVPHCTAVGIGPPDTAHGGLVGQTWDWMESVFGMSSLVRWQRPEGPSLLAYAFPGLWVGAGLNSAGLALAWTSADLGKKALGARVGIPSYALLTHLLYQESLEAASEEARRVTHAGWFTFVMGDAAGNLVNIEGSPNELAVERAKGRLTRVGFGSRQMTKTVAERDVKLHERCMKVWELIEESRVRVDAEILKRWFAEPGRRISVGKATIDLMVFDTQARIAHLSRGPSYGVAWQKFAFAS